MSNTHRKGNQKNYLKKKQTNEWTKLILNEHKNHALAA